MKAADSGLEIIKFKVDLEEVKNAATRNLELAFHTKQHPGTNNLKGMEWNFWLYDVTGEKMLEYIAYDDIDVGNPGPIDERQAKQTAE